jgi:hypothetical protein
MKKLSALVIGLMFAFGAYAQQAEKEEEKQEKQKKVDGPAVSFEKESHDFGDIYQGDKVQHVFTFENTGTEPLIITNVQVTCGCTAPRWPRDPIAPGQEGEITIQFNSTGKIGRQNKVITIVSNSVDPHNKISIVTNVLPKKQDTVNK